MTQTPERKAILAAQQAVLDGVLAELQRKEALALVKAPPGSGKTELLVRAASSLVRDQARIAVAAQTNAQADDICSRLLQRGVRPVVRLVGSAGANVPAGVRIVRKAMDHSTGPCVMVATTRKWEYGDLPEFDALFVDEAWQMTWSAFLGLDRVASRFVLIGDPGQIPPVVTVDTSFWETTRRPPHLPAPAILASEGLGRQLELPASWRLPADSVDAVRGFYDFRFQGWAAPGDRELQVTGRARDAVDAAIDRLRSGSIVALTLPPPPGGAPPAVDGELAGLAVTTVQRLLDRKATALRLDAKTPERKVLEPSDIGLCATHRVMNARMEELRPAGLADTRIDTAERWQGLQRKVMVVVHPLSGVEEPSVFDLETGRLCVMASRHEVGLILVTRDQVGRTLDGLIVSAEQAVGRPDVSGRGHARHSAFWRRLEEAGRCVAA